MAHALALSTLIIVEMVAETTPQCMRCIIRKWCLRCLRCELVWFMDGRRGGVGGGVCGEWRGKRNESSRRKERLERGHCIGKGWI